jgi:hypothetical protein
MKSQLIILIFVFLFINHFTAQPDKQWLIWNNLGKDGLLPDGISNNYTSTNAIGPTFTLTNVRHASYTPTRPARTDLFVIYEDGSHFNSRYLPDSSFFCPGSNSLDSYTSHNFKTNHSGSNIAYGYMTRTYEGDDPPGSVQALNGNSGQNSTPFTFDVTTYTPSAEYPNDTIRASHDVVKGKDITIIIDQLKLQNYSKQRQLAYDYYLVFNEIAPARATFARAPTDSYFNLEPIFYRSSHRADEAGFPFHCFSFSTSDPQKIKLVYDPGNQYTYVNLRPTDALDPYGPDDSGETYNAIFKIVNGSNVTVTQMAEPILRSHDPNLIRVDTIICADEYQEVYYYLQFQNTSPVAAASHVSAAVSFPPYFDASSFTPIEYSIRGERIRGNFVDDGGVFKFSFGDNPSLDVCASTYDTDDCTGYVKFKINVPKSTNLKDINNSLALRNPHTIFDSITYPIEIFEDWVIRDPNHRKEWIRPIDCGEEEGGGLCWWHYLIILLVLVIVVLLVIRWNKPEETVTT